MLRWLTENLVPVKALPAGIQMSEEEREHLSILRQQSVAELLRLRELGGEKREKMWPRLR
jgi:hypothetical protein